MSRVLPCFLNQTSVVDCETVDRLVRPFAFDPPPVWFLGAWVHPAYKEAYLDERSEDGKRD